MLMPTTLNPMMTHPMTTMPWSNLRVTMVSSMLLHHQRDNAKRDSGSARTKWAGKWTNSQENSTSKTTLTLLQSPESLVSKSQESTPGNFLILPSPSQESEDINSSKRTWTCSSTSKTTLTPTSQTPSTSPTSSRLERLLLPT